MATTQGGAFPFVESGHLFVERALQWGEQYGIGVLIDFHAAPGSQNGACQPRRLNTQVNHEVERATSAAGFDPVV